ncbi:MAG: type II toxin-antitoxin system VapC family toxin [Gammaproteobacteria bacterium]
MLDTHILLRSLLEPKRLAKRVALALEAPENELWLSPITTWEVLMLAEKGRVLLNPEPKAWIRKAYRTMPFKEAPLNHEVALVSRDLRLPHQDPADRFLAATALVYDLVLVTSDERLFRSKALTTPGNG